MLVIHYNTVRPHSSLGYLPPTPQVLVWPTTMMAKMSALNKHSNRTTQWDPATVYASVVAKYFQPLD
jgi:hypothetical protein